MFNIKESITKTKTKIKDKMMSFKSFLKRKKKVLIFIMILVLLFVVGFFVPYKITYYFTFIVGTLWYCVFRFKIKISEQHENTPIIVKTSYYRDWILNLTFIFSLFFVYFIYICGITKGLI